MGAAVRHDSADRGFIHFSGSFSFDTWPARTHEGLLGQDGSGNSISLALTDVSATVFSSDALPTAALTLASFGWATLAWEAGGHTLSSMLTSLQCSNFSGTGPDPDPDPGGGTGTGTGGGDGGGGGGSGGANGNGTGRGGTGGPVNTVRLPGSLPLARRRRRH